MRVKLLLLAMTSFEAFGVGGATAAPGNSTPSSGASGEPDRSPGSSIIVAGQAFEIGRPVVLWSDPQGFDGYQTRCIDQSGGCCDNASKRYGVRGGLSSNSLVGLKQVVSQVVLHFDGCVNSRSCFKSMHNRPRPEGSAGCGLSAHFMIDSDGTIYQTLDLMERAYHAEEVNTTSVGVEICNRGRVDRTEWPRLPAEYRTRPTREVVVNGQRHVAYEFRPEQYDSIIALTRALLRIFPRIKAMVPELPDGTVALNTLPDPLSFSGILGHLHVDLQRQKWDPGPLDFDRILRALNGFYFPVPIRSFVEVPRTESDLLAARRAAFYNAEERASAFFPVASGRLWHSGVHLRSAIGTLVRAPTRGRIVAARRAIGGDSSRSFILIRHNLEVDGSPLVFFSLLAHLDLSTAARNEETVPWLQNMQRASPEQRKAFLAGEVVLLDERVEAGDPVGTVGLVNRGPEHGAEVHFETFTSERLSGDMGRAFRVLNAATDGPFVRRADLMAMIDGNGDGQIDAEELRRFFRRGTLDRRQSLRRLAVRHRHEWGDRTTAYEFVTARELAAISETERRQLYARAIAPYVFWTDDVARAAGLPLNQVVYSYNPITFLTELAARTAKVKMPALRGREVGQTSILPRRLSYVPLADWASSAPPVERPLFGSPVGMRLGPPRREDIPLIELPPTDGR